MKADAAAALATFIQDGVVLIAALIAWRQVGEARRLRQEQAQPYVVISYEPEPAAHGMTRLVITNLGTTAAVDVSFEFDPHLSSALDEGSPVEVASWYAFAEGIPVLVPGQAMSTLFDSLPYRCSPGNIEKYPRLTNVTVKYRSSTGKQFQQSYVLDFLVYYNRLSVGQKYFDDLVESVESIAATLKGWTEAGAGPGLRAYTQGLERYRDVVEANHRAARQRFEERRAAVSRQRATSEFPETPDEDTGSPEPISERSERPRLMQLGLVRLRSRRRLLRRQRAINRRLGSA